LERDVRSLSERCLDASTSLQEFIVAQIERTKELTGTSSDVLDIRRKSRHLASALGVSADLIEDGSKEVARMTIAMTPYIRARLLFHSSMRSNGPLESAIAVERLPDAVLAVHALAQLAFAAGLKRHNFQTFSAMLDRHLAVVSALSQLDVPIAWRRDRAVDWSPGILNSEQYGQYVALAHSLLWSRQRRAPMSLGELLAVHNRGEGLERTDFLRFVGERTHKRTHRVTAGKEAMPAPTLRESVRQRVLSAIPSPAFVDACRMLSGVARSDLKSQGWARPDQTVSGAAVSK
jgi:hypothetical protein